ncbi:hypothetical protein [uncultured Bacteroides sp.]|uniref:hypothetical protein n=1 Tax=uncultured Bacteroides sp. TaxID=162156 RepID=UPI002614D3F5|nr:hypothetical protein [uncultured Bacteroides sp.]
MKILFVGVDKSEDHLRPTEQLFEEKLHDSSLEDIEVMLIDVATLGSPGEKQIENDLKTRLCSTDAIIVMDQWEKELLTRFLDYDSWNKIHLFSEYKVDKEAEDKDACEADFPYRTDNQKTDDICSMLIEKLSALMNRQKSSNLAIA